MFGKSGIQARIIENAIPDIEDEANLLLSRMTDNALQLRLKPLRETKSGSGEIDTLEIEISDQEGTRPYELFSGGEAFRANFALRIALSRLLTRRAGTALRTLILDEGFGTQDARGRERLVEAIEAVRDDTAVPIPAEEGLACTLVLEAIAESLRTGQPAIVPPVSQDGDPKTGPI